ncbi:MAG: hypothetical protein L3K17_00895 [Thermoplasmata archaeon]|nr:hypothetical protein [Thermoplasmata archaeon]
MNAQPLLERAALAERTTRRPLRPAALPAVALVVALLALTWVPFAGAAPVATAPTAVAATPATGLWAWGAFANTTYSSQYVGAFADALNLTGGNFSAAGAFVAESATLHAELGAFAVVNATAPTNTTRSIEAGAIALANYSGVLAVVGDLPAAGTYAANASVPLVNTTSYYLASIVEVTAYVVFANYTLVNGTLALANEHIGAWTAVNTTTIAYNWPNATVNPNGSTTVRYTTAAFAEVAWVGEVISVRFSPALPIAETPLSVGKSWNATTTATATGWAAYAAEAAWSVAGMNASSANSGVTSLNATANLTFGFTVTGAETVIFPNGTSATGYAIAETEQGSSSGSYELWDGLVALPTSAPAPTGALRPATPFDAHAAGTTATVVPTTTIVDASGLPVSSTSTVSGTAVAAAPMAPTSANERIAGAGTPAKPTGAPTPPPASVPSTKSTPPPATTSPPPASGGTSGGNGPSTTRGSSSGLGFAMLVAAVAIIAAVFLGIALVRERRRA